MTADDINIRRMTREELDRLVEWAAREGWNPGLGDAEVFWNSDPDGFVAAEIRGELLDSMPGRSCSRRGGRRCDPRLRGHAALPDRS